MPLQSGRSNREGREPRTILLVEDEPFVREATCSILQRAGYRVLSAEDAPQALEAWEQHGGNVELLMADTVLPGKSGDELGEELRKRSAVLPVLLTSGYGGVEEREAPETRTYFLAKPYSRRSLIDKIEAILGVAKVRAAQAG